MEAKIGLKKFRRRMCWTQEELASKVGLDKNQQNVSDWEKGHNPGISVIKKLFELEATVEELFEVDYNTIQGLAKSEKTTNKDLLPKILSQLENMNLRFDNVNLRLDNLETKNNQPQRGNVAKAG